MQNVGHGVTAAPGTSIMDLKILAKHRRCGCHLVSSAPTQQTFVPLVWCEAAQGVHRVAAGGSRQTIMGKRVLMVLTSQSVLGNTGKPTGWYLPEVAHPYKVFKKNGFSTTFMSPAGGKAPMDPASLVAFKDDAICQEFLADTDVKKQLENTLTVDQVSASDFDAVFYAGGHGPMFDIPDNMDIAKVASQVYKNGGVLAAVCHGTVGLVPIKLPDGKSVVDGQTVTSFTNSEEDAVDLSKAMPFMLETRLKELGAKFKAAENWQKNVVVSGRIVTGQNPASATATGEAVVQVLSKS